MKSKFNLNDFLDAMRRENRYVCINEAIYSWNDNSWTPITNKHGEAEVLYWIQDNEPEHLTRSNVRQAWETLKLDLLGRSPKVSHRGILIPCQGTYVQIDESGDITTTPPDRYHYCTYALACSYNPDAPRPLFDAFLAKILPDTSVRNRVQEFIGYTLLHDARYQRAALWLGSGANGKGALSNIVQALHEKVQAIQLDNTSRFALSGLYQASLIVADELPARRLDEAKLKSVIAGESIFIDIKKESPITTRIHGKILVLGNNYPIVDDASEGFWRRWDVVPFKVTIPANERDPRLAQTIIDHELAGVLNWALEGLQRLLRRDGFEPEQPDAMKLTIQNAKAVADDVTGWLSARVQSISGPVSTSKSTVYSDYREWCAANDFVPKTTQGFWLKLKRCRTDLEAKKVRIPGGGLMNACSITLRDVSSDHPVANTGTFHVAA